MYRITVMHSGAQFWTQRQLQLYINACSCSYAEKIPSICYLTVHFLLTTCDLNQWYSTGGTWRYLRGYV